LGQRLAMMLWSLIIFLTQVASAADANFQKLREIKQLQRLAFGSCNRQYNQQPLWKDLIQKKPDLFIWAGDNVYANSKDPKGIMEAYLKQEQIEDYGLFKTQIPMIGTWDDHDFSHDNSNGSYAHKRISQQYFLDFIGEPKLSGRRFQEGVYASYQFGDVPEQVKIILLDNRYFKDLDPAAPLLGKQQWEWLERELKSSTASLHLLVAGLSFFAPQMPMSEEWEDYPIELNRLLSLVKKYKPKGILFLSGDKHFATIFARHGHLEFMSSGLTHATRLPLRPYVRKKYANPFFNLNYGMIDIGWNNANPQLTMSIQDRHGISHQTTHVTWQDDNWVEIAPLLH
jgi:alkaline phosphatase D